MLEFRHRQEGTFFGIVVTSIRQLGEAGSGYLVSEVIVNSLQKPFNDTFETRLVFRAISQVDAKIERYTLQVIAVKLEAVVEYQ
jgi:hypothetical protein